jgi:hypothetical protein
MKVSIQKRARHLHAELQGRESAADMRAFLVAVKNACRENGEGNVLLFIRDSDAVFRAEEYGLAGDLRGYVNQMVTPGCRIALVGDTSELLHAHEYVAIVARQQHINVRAFRDPRAAQLWLESDEAVDPPRSDGLQPARTPKLP